MSTDNLSSSVIFPLGEKVESPNFSGAVWMNMLTPRDSACPVGNVTFEPGCINSWHTHAGGQVLLATGGRGYYQEWGKPARELHAGDVVEIPQGAKHWHGAATDSWFVHLFILVNPEIGLTTWLEPVSHEEYSLLK
ncbi:MAG: cupin domain-containing protein [Dehalococcoidia bacterium]|nr:cupin domain-containing protein [Dehalococcoidia bacterium]